MMSKLATRGTRIAGAVLCRALLSSLRVSLTYRVSTLQPRKRLRWQCGRAGWRDGDQGVLWLSDGEAGAKCRRWRAGSCLRSDFALASVTTLGGVLIIQGCPRASLPAGRCTMARIVSRLSVHVVLCFAWHHEQP